jgi:drug/metabolite transporter (DMT)-like permease
MTKVGQTGSAGLADFLRRIMKLKHWFVFIALGLIWSSSFLFIKIAVTEIAPMVLVALRMLFGMLTAVIVAVTQKVQWPRDWKTWRVFAILGPTSLAIPIFLISWGEQSIDSAVASILNATVPLFTLIIAHFWLQDDKITPQKALGLLIGFVGIVILLSEDLMTGSQSSIIGQGAVILAAVFYAWSAVFARKATHDIPGNLRSSAVLITATIFMWVFGPIAQQPFTMPQLPITWGAILWLGILGSGLATIMLYYLIHEVGPTRATLVTYIFPPGGVLLGVIFLNEEITWQLIAGTLLVVGSLVVVNWKGKP